MNKLISLLIIVVLTACGSAKKATAEPTATATETATTNPRFTVSFISIGSGTDKKAKQQFDTFVTDFGTKNKVKLSYETSHWGREGEYDCCFKLSELDKKQQETFITETKEALKSSTLVRYKENSPCQQKK